MADDGTSNGRLSLSKPGWLTPTKIAEGIIVGAAVISLLYKPIDWITGGLISRSQTDLAEVQKATSEAQKINALIISRLDAVTQTQAADKAAQLTAIDNLKQLFATRLDAMWRPSDYADRDAHLSRLDTVFDGLRDKTTDNAYAIRELQKQYQGLTTIPTPGPARR